MSAETASIARLHAVEVSGDESVVEGPLHGYHHETYVFPLLGEMGRVRPGRWKCREPRADLLWFDRRCFVSEEQLLQSLAGRIRGIPEIVEVGGLGLMRFIEGRTLGSVCSSGSPVPAVYRRQIIDLFEQLVTMAPASISAGRRCEPDDRPDDGDTEGFLERLVHFTEHQVYQHNLDRFETLFSELGLGEDSFKHLRKHVSGLTERPFCLLHADLHRENFIVDPGRRLWTIDWELAMVGDPLYDLATHLHLMRYPDRQARGMAEQWRTTVERVRPGSANGWRQDLNRLIGYKRAQSVFTDVIRAALSLDTPANAGWRHVVPVALKLRAILAEAARPLGLEALPGPHRVVTALGRWCRAHGSGREM
ncbi:aminoglycoside phosphotransferase family protein [Streptomyces sp. NPDC001835]|uniref:aminoglycoside phosphotransferase family protein n=1 Tax=Streptomyces sp. NPDC001835 TaxID=3154528 RepID=UPI00332B7E60